MELSASLPPAPSQELPYEQGRERIQHLVSLRALEEMESLEKRAQKIIQQFCQPASSPGEGLGASEVICN